MTHGSLFSGIGGFDLAAEWMGWENKFHCEWNEFGQKVLHHYWPNVEQFTDIKKSNFTKYANRIDILTGGFPCQPYSSAGKRLGKEDDRHLWPEMLRAVKEIQPRWIVGENVYGLVNWSGGLVFHEVQADLEAEGYEVFPYLLPAVSVNAPHRRDRIWFVAFNTKSKRDTKIRGICERQDNESIGVCEINGDAANTNSTDSQAWSQRQVLGQQNREKANGYSNVERRNKWENFPTVAPIRMRDDGVSNKLLRFVVKEFYDTISYTSQENRIKNLQEVWDAIQSEEIWEQIRGLYSLESKNVLLQTMQLYSSEWNQQGELSPFGEELCQPILQHLSKYKEFRCSPQGQELEKQRFIQFGNTLSLLPHEVALAARRFETAIAKFESWHRNESIKAGGNAIVPQVVYQIFKAIEEYERISTTSKSI